MQAGGGMSDERTGPVRISAFFPAFNEEENIRPVVEEALSVLSDIADECEVLVVLYEGSTDRTGEIVREMAAKDPRVRLLVQPQEQRGYGTAMRIGYENSRYEYIFYSDADRQYDLQELRGFLPLIRGAALVVGYRRKRKDPLMRLFVAWVYNCIMRASFELEQRDVDCAFKLVRKSIFDRISLNCRTGLSDTELLVKARLAGYEIVEVGVSHFPRAAGGAKFDIGSVPKPGVVLDIFRELSGLRREIAPAVRRAGRREAPHGSRGE